MRELLRQIHYATSANLSVSEIVLLALLGTIAWHNRKDEQWFPPTYCIFLILYITLLRRAPGYNESIRLRLKLWPNAGVWAGNLLNLLLYVPYGATSWQWKQEGKKIVAIGFALHYRTVDIQRTYFCLCRYGPWSRASECGMYERAVGQ